MFALCGFHQPPARLRESLSIPSHSETPKEVLQATGDGVTPQVLLPCHGLLQTVAIFTFSCSAIRHDDRMETSPPVV